MRARQCRLALSEWKRATGGSGLASWRSVESSSSRDTLHGWMWSLGTAIVYPVSRALILRSMYFRTGSSIDSAAIHVRATTTAVIPVIQSRRCRFDMIILPVPAAPVPPEPPATTFPGQSTAPSARPRRPDLDLEPVAFLEVSQGGLRRQVLVDCAVGLPECDLAAWPIDLDDLAFHFLDLGVVDLGHPLRVAGRSGQGCCGRQQHRRRDEARQPIASQDHPSLLPYFLSAAGAWPMLVRGT